MGRPAMLWLLATLCVPMSGMITGCRTTVPASQASVIPGTAAGIDTSYRLQIGDSITLHFLAFPDLDDSATIGPDGRIALRLVGDFPVAGMTIAEAAKEANARYETVVRHPGITIVIKSYSLQQIYVNGEVASPGVIRSSIPLTAAGAIAQAGGIKLATANAHGALLLRRKPDGTIVYYKLAFHGDLPGGEGDPILRSNDLIYVPRTALASVADFITANITRIVPVNATYSYFTSY